MSNVVLVCEDDKDILNLISYNLEKEGFKPLGVIRGDQVVKKVIDEKPAVILLDVMLPEKSGLEICREIRAHQEIKNIPIILVSARTTENDRITGLEAGADDYVTKPFSMRELLARVRAAIRRENHKEEPENLRLDRDAFKVYMQGKEVQLTLTEFIIFAAVVERRGKAITKELLGEILDRENPVSSRSIDVHVASLRKKLNQMGDCIETIRGIGFRFKREVVDEKI